jgi:hypothetical protein
MLKYYINIINDIGRQGYIDNNYKNVLSIMWAVHDIYYTPGAKQVVSLIPYYSHAGLQHISKFTNRKNRNPGIGVVEMWHLKSAARMSQNNDWYSPHKQKEISPILCCSQLCR